MNEKLKVKDNVTLTLRDALTGSIISKSTHNIVTYPGEFFAVDRIYTRSNAVAFNTTNAYCAVGTGSVANNYWIGSLTTEVSGIGNPGRDTPNAVTRSTQTLLVSTYFDTTQASGNLTEVGLFCKGYDSGGNLQTASTAKDSGVLLSYATFAAITKNDTNSLTIDWELLF